jgi:hypothetical protein
MTALAISGMMINGAFLVELFAVWMAGQWAKRKHEWIAALFLLTCHLINLVELHFS